MHKFKIRLGKVLIAFSFIILLLALSFNIDSNRYNTSTVIINDGNNGIPSTTIDDSQNENENSNTSIDNNSTDNNTNSNSNNSDTTTNNNSGNGGNTGKGGNNTNSNNNNTTNNNSNSTDNNSATSNNNNSSSNKTNTNPTPEPVNSLETTVNNLRSNIENTYGITIKYGNEVIDYVVGGYSIVPCTDLNTIYNALLSLQYNISLYPTNFFREIKTAGIPLNIYLIQRYSYQYITGITERVANGAIISIALDYPIAETFHHENYHYMEHFIYAKGGGYTNWNNYNPSGFSYGTTDNNLVYDVTFSEDAYFVNSYAQSYDYEDRASTFEYMVADNKISALNNGKHIWLKAKVMCETIDYYFNTVSPNTTEFWEKHVY